MKRLLITVCLVIVMQSSIALTQDEYPLTTAEQRAQFQALSQELRCLVCQNQNLADSHAPLAKDLRAIVYEQVKAGKSKQDIIDFLTQRYGDFVLFKPPVKPSTFILWFAPALFLLLGMGLLIRRIRRGQ